MLGKSLRRDRVPESAAPSGTPSGKPRNGRARHSALALAPTCAPVGRDALAPLAGAGAFFVRPILGSMAPAPLPDGPEPDPHPEAHKCVLTPFGPFPALLWHPVAPSGFLGPFWGRGPYLQGQPLPPLGRWAVVGRRGLAGWAVGLAAALATRTGRPRAWRACARVTPTRSRVTRTSRAHIRAHALALCAGAPTHTRQGPCHLQPQALRQSSRE